MQSSAPDLKWNLENTFVIKFYDGTAQPHYAKYTHNAIVHKKVLLPPMLGPLITAIFLSLTVIELHWGCSIIGKYPSTILTYSSNYGIHD